MSVKIKQNGQWVVSDAVTTKIEIDKTLSKENMAADAKVVGDALAGKQPAGDYVLTKDVQVVHDWALATAKPEYTAAEIGADPYGTADSVVLAHNTATDSHADIREAIAAKPSVELDDTLSIENKAADAKAVGDALADIQLRTVSGSVSRSGQVVTMKFTLEDGSVEVHEMHLDNDDYPINLFVNGTEIPLDWSGFDNG